MKKVPGQGVALKSKAFPYLERTELDSSIEELRAAYKAHARGELYSLKIRDIFRKYLPLKGNLLDLGSSNGRIFEVLSELGAERTNGADIADYLSAGKPSGSFRTFDFNVDRFPYDDEEFDGITSIEVIEHLENPYHFLRECARVLKPGGILLLSTPNADHLYNKISFFLRGRFYRFLDGNDHIMLFSDHILSKGTKRYFDLVAREYMFGELPYRIFSKFRYPENKAFGRTAFYIFKKR